MVHRIELMVELIGTSTKTHVSPKSKCHPRGSTCHPREAKKSEANEAPTNIPPLTTPTQHPTKFPNHTVDGVGVPRAVAFIDYSQSQY